MLNSSKPLKKGAVTGGLSSGKSTVCRFFQELGAYVVSADEIVHELLLVNQEIIQKVIELLGVDILEGNRIDRAKIAKKVFHQPLYLKSLEDLLHPAVRQEIRNQYELKKKEGKISLFIAEIPLLFESNSEMDFDFTIAVIADKEICKTRVSRSENLKIDFDERWTRQLSLEEKAKRATYVLINNGSLAELKKAVNNLYNTINSEK